jgi:hypothetical protein
MNVYTHSQLPKDGWIKGCFVCSRPTSNSMSYNYKEKVNTVFLCKNCEKRNINSTAPNIFIYSFQEKLNRYINENTLEPFKARIYSLDPPIIKRRETPLPPPNIPENKYTPPRNLDDIV